MAYQLRYTATAATELRAATDWIAERAPETAERWFEGFVELLATLRVNALAHGLAPEDSLVTVEVRQIIYRTASRRFNRALYTVADNTVVILGIRRPGQRLLTKRDVQGRLAE
jgi:plasmid stabilization system protein ParE